MSWDIELIGAGPVPLSAEGGTHAIDGSTEAELNVTYNYSPFYYDVLHVEGIRWLHNKRAKDTIEALDKTVKKLGIEQDTNYWKATEGNAGYALHILATWAKMYPDAVWEVT